MDYTLAEKLDVKPEIMNYKFSAFFFFRVLKRGAGEGWRRSV